MGGNASVVKRNTRPPLELYTVVISWDEQKKTPATWKKIATLSAGDATSISLRTPPSIMIGKFNKKVKPKWTKYDWLPVSTRKRTGN